MSFPVQPYRPPSLGPQWSAWIVIVAILFLAFVFAFYYYTG